MDLTKRVVWAEVEQKTAQNLEKKRKNSGSVVREAKSKWRFEDSYWTEKRQSEIINRKSEASSKPACQRLNKGQNKQEVVLKDLEEY